MPDTYHAPALILTALLLPAFGYLYHRYRDARTLLWLLGFLLSIVAMLLLYPMGSRTALGDSGPWMKAAGRSAFLAGTAVFLASLSPLGFRFGGRRILYVIPFTAPLVLYSLLLYGVYGGHPTHLALLLVFPTLGAVSLVACYFWGADPYSMPRWLGIAGCVALGGVAYWVFLIQGATSPLFVVESANLFMTALLVAFVFRRISPGVVLTVTGFLAWSLTGVRLIPSVLIHSAADIHLLQVIITGKVVAAMGMILLALEDEVAANKAGREREHRARLELEAYTRLMLSRRHVRDFDQQGQEICDAVAAHSRFTQVGLLLHSGGRFRLAGSAGLEAAITKALDDLAGRLPATGFLATGSAPLAVDGSHTAALDLEPWLAPGDDLKRLGFTRVLAVPMLNRAVTEGALLLAGMRPTDQTKRPGRKLPGLQSDVLRADDLLPIEMFAARLQATRSQTMMFEKLIDSEKFGHLGQLAASVTQQLNNPLTVILGYASLLESTATLEPQDRKGVESILVEARHMRDTLESLARISRPQSDQLAAVSIAELLTDLGELHRPEFLERSIQFRMSVAPNLPRALCSPQQLRQAVRHCMQFAMDAVASPGAALDESRVIRLEAASEDGRVQILIAHSGPAFVSPERAFDPFMPPQNGSESTGLGLSLCATILRDNEGRASAVNLDPHGAAIILELKAA
jgi:signal transduction histidine kinase